MWSVRSGHLEPECGRAHGSELSAKTLDVTLKTSWTELLHILRILIKEEIRVRGYKTFFMLSSVEHEILEAHNVISIKITRNSTFFRLR